MIYSREGASRNFFKSSEKTRLLTKSTQDSWDDACFDLITDGHRNMVRPCCKA